MNGQISDRGTRIGVAVDNSASSRAALQWACDLAAKRGVDLVVASVVVAPAGGPRGRTPEVDRLAHDEVVDRIVSRCTSDAFHVHVVDGTPSDLAHSIATALAGCDPVVVGSPDSADHRLLAYQLAHACNASVVEVDPDGEATPVSTDGILLPR